MTSGTTSDADTGPADSTSAYRVLARKYRPQTFEDLIGQDPVVQTLSNAFETDRIAQAYMLTGVRGIGKTTTARLIARALNYDNGSGESGPSVRMPEPGAHCQAILESRHVDVIEMDAASRTGIEDVREIIESVRYKPVSARYKIYIIDEVHMLSRQAFNALLKTLEEPPEHVKFIFATTEIRKVPVTVLSRCQRFDLRRLEPELLIDHFRKISELEGVKAEDEALALIARASEGSVRDGLSLLDQAIAFAGDEIKAGELRQMLGLADRDRIIDLFEALMRGDAAAALAELDEQHRLGADPATVLTDLAELVHWVTRLKIVPGADSDAAHSPSERKRGSEFASALSMPVLTRAWQMLLRGIQEVSLAANPSAAAEMVVIRLAYAAELPSPAAVIERAAKAPAAPAPVQSREPQTHPGPVTEARAQTQLDPADYGEAPGPPPPEPVALASFADVVALAGERRDIRLKTELEAQVRLVSFAPGRLEIALQPGTRPSFPNELMRKLQQWTSERWFVAVSEEKGDAPIKAQKEEQRQSLFREARENETVKAVLEKFPGAELMDVRDLADTNGSDGPDPDPAPDINED
ncbi:MAG: DNA polymerase III subunit gamma/tau [Pseudomonadota bacterium]